METESATFHKKNHQQKSQLPEKGRHIFLKRYNFNNAKHLYILYNRTRHMVCVTSEWKRKNSSSRSWNSTRSHRSIEFPTSQFLLLHSPQQQQQQHLARQFLLIKAFFLFMSLLQECFFYFSIECDVTFFKSKGGSLNPTSFFGGSARSAANDVIQSE
jgi:hypothetical protein